MIGVVPHQGREIERYRKSGLPVREKELVPLICVPSAPESRELSHRPQATTIAGWVNAPRVRKEAGHSKCLGARLGGVEWGVDRLDFLFRVGERDVAHLTLLVLLPPLGDL